MSLKCYRQILNSAKSKVQNYKIEAFNQPCCGRDGSLQLANGTNKLECNIALSGKGLPGTSTLLLGPLLSNKEKEVL
jgi:hypothetical protein